MTVVFILFILLIWGGKEALQEFTAEKYVNEKRGKSTSFVGFMLFNHPLIFIGGIFVLIIIIAVAIN